jgi:ketosteroid isomerase-like protein
MDDWHRAASEVDADRYLGYLAEESVFLGTDPSERWDKEQFSAYVEHYFKDLKRGWTYHPSERQVRYSSDGKLAWFDERLENAGYGVLRGSGVLHLEAAGWRIVHYSMTFAVPNAKVKQMVQLLGLAEEPASSPDLESSGD